VGLDTQLRVGDGVVMQTCQAAQRGEPPLLLAPVGHGEVARLAASQPRREVAGSRRYAF
jgi:hypothetical protein